MGDGCYTADGVRSRILPGTSSTQNSNKSQFLDAAETGDSSEKICLLSLLLGTEGQKKYDFLSHNRWL